MSGSSGSQTSTTTQQSGPPAYLQPYLKYGAEQGAQLYQSPSPSYFPGSTVANQSPATQAGIQAAIARGLNGNPATNAATGYLTNVLGGQYLGGQNLDAIHQSIRDATLPSIAAQFSLAGRYGSPDMAGTETTALANAFAPYDYGNYQQERQLQQAAAGLAPTLANQDWTDIQGLQQAGAATDQFEQNKLNAGIDRWNYDQNLAYNKLAQYMGLLSGNNFGTTGTSTQTIPNQSGSPLGFLGGLLGSVL